MAIRILTEDDKRELEGKLAQAGNGPDAVIQTPSRLPGDRWTAEQFSVTAGSLAAVWQKGLQGQLPVVMLMYTGESEGDEIREYYTVTHISTDDMGTLYSRVAVEFSVRANDLVWKCTLISQGEDNIRHNVFTECRYLDDGEDLSGYAQKTELPTKVSQLANDSGYLTEVPAGYATEGFVEEKIEQAAMGGGEVDLSGYATEQWVREGYQPRGSYLTQVPEGYATEDFVEEKLARVETGVVCVTVDPVTMRSSHTPEQILDSANAGKVVQLRLPAENEADLLPLFQATQSTAVFSTTGYGGYNKGYYTRTVEALVRSDRTVDLVNDGFFDSRCVPDFEETDVGRVLTVAEKGLQWMEPPAGGGSGIPVIDTRTLGFPEVTGPGYDQTVTISQTTFNTLKAMLEAGFVKLTMAAMGGVISMGLNTAVVELPSMTQYLATGYGEGNVLYRFEIGGENGTYGARFTLT